MNNHHKRKTGNLTRILLQTKPYWPLLLLCAVSVVLVNVAELLKPYIVKIVIDDFLTDNAVQKGIYSVVGMGLMYLLAVVVSTVLTYVQTNAINYVGQSVIKSIRKRVFSHIQLMPLRLLDKFSSGRLITRATNDVEALSELFTDVLVNLFKDIFMLAGILFVMIRMDGRLSLVALTGLPIIAIVTVVARNKLRKNFILIKSVIGQINGFFAENIAGMKIVQIFNRQGHKIRQFDNLNAEYYKYATTQVRVNSILRPVMEVINSTVIALIIFYGYNRITGGTLNLGVLYAFTTYIKQFFEPINDMAETYTTIQSASVSADRIYEMLDNEHEQEDLNAGDHMEHCEGVIEFKNVWFAYADEDWVLKDVSFRVEKGQSVAFVGATGSGKTTIISLIARFYDIQKGQILLDGVDISTIRLGDLRHHIAVVLQDVFLFAGTILDNVRLDDDLEKDRVMSALELSHAIEFINVLPSGIDYPVTERGSTFSSGQRQLISFARAAAREPAVFVLDEATANIDTQTERLITQSLEAVSLNRTTIIIAHRLSTIRDCDIIFVMRHGKIIERGTHEELMNLGGNYLKLHKAQISS